MGWSLYPRLSAVSAALNGRSATPLSVLVAGVANSTNGGPDHGGTKTFPGALTFSSNGARQDMIGYQLALKLLF